VIATRTRRIIALAAVCLGNVACDHVFFQEPSRYTSVPLALTLMPSSVMGGQPEAFDKVDRVRIRVLDEDGIRLDSTIAVTPGGRDIELSFDLDIASRTESLTLQAELRRGAEPLFRASAPIPLGAGRIVEIRLTLEPVPSALLLPSSVPTVTAYGDSVRINGALVFATGDTVSVGPVQWTSLDPAIVAIVDNVPVARADGSARLVGRSGALADTVIVRVLATVQTITIEPVVTVLQIGQSRQLMARLLDRRGNVIPRSPLWSSSNSSIISVSTTGLIRALAVGRATITAASGSVSSSLDIQVTASPPTVTTDGAVQVGVSSAVLRGTVTPNGASSETWFEYSTSSTLASPRVTQMVGVGSGLIPVPTSAPVTGLASGTRYFFRAVARNAFGTVTGEILSFVTSVSPPAVATLGFTVDSDFTVLTLIGSVNPNGAPTDAWFEWGPDPTLTTSVATTPVVPVGSGSTALTVTADIQSFDPYEVYYFRVVARSPSGTVKGAILRISILGSVPKL
jgi:hypothetical protein